MLAPKITLTSILSILLPFQSSRVFGFDASSFRTINPPLSAIKHQHGHIQQIVSIIQHHRHGTAFCSTFLHASSITVTRTKTIIATHVRTTATETASPPVTVTSTDTSLIAATPTLYLSSNATDDLEHSSVADPFPHQNDVHYIESALQHDLNRTRLPYWLDQYSCPQVSKACSKAIVPGTSTKTLTSTQTSFRGANATVTLTPTITSVTTSLSVQVGTTVTSMVLDTTPSSSTATGMSTASTPSQTSVPAQAGRIRLNAAVDNSFRGYFGSSWNIFGEYGIISDPQSALIVTLDTAPGTDGGSTNLAIKNATAPSLPYLGAILGFESSGTDLSSGSLNYAVAGAVAPVASGKQSTDTYQNSYSQVVGDPKVYESCIWFFDGPTNRLSASWTNSDGSAAPNLTMVLNSEAMVWTSDLEAFIQKFGTQNEAVVAVFESVQ